MAAIGCLPRAHFFKSANTQIAQIFFLTNTRGYARFAHRKPVKILSSEEASQLNRRLLGLEEEKPIPRQIVKPFVKKTDLKSEEALANSTVTNARHSKPSAKQQRNFNNVAPTTPKLTNEKQTQSIPKDNSKTKQITILKLSSKEGKSIQLQVVDDKKTAERKLAGLMQNVKSPKARKNSGLIMLEGDRLLAEAINCGLQAEALFFSKPELLVKLNLPKDIKTELYQVCYEKIQLWSELTTSPGLIGVFNLKKIKEVWSKATQDLPLTMICDSIRDPGNMGAILRCAAAAGCKLVVTTPDCVDVWDSKVLRAAAGAHFKVKMALNVGWDLIAGSYVSDDASVILAESSMHKKNETPLATEETETIVKFLAQEEATAGNQSKSTEVLDDGESLCRDSSYLNERLLKYYRKLQLTEKAYNKLTPGDCAVLVIGGETHGLSSAAHKLAHEYGGCKAYIPMENQIDSLNAAVAAGILTYELRRKLLESKACS